MIQFPKLPEDDCLTTDDLENIGKYERIIKNIKIALENTAPTLKAYNYNRVKVNNSKANKTDNDIIQYLAKMERLENELKIYELKVAELKEKAINIIMRIDSKQQQEVLIQRYIQYKQFADICNNLHYADMSTLFQLRKRALKSFLEVQK